MPDRMIGGMPEASDAPRSPLEDRIEFEALVADFTARFVNLDVARLDDVIDEVLARLGEALDADRGGLTQFLDAQGTLVFTHFWSSSGIAQPPRNLIAANVYPFGYERIMRGEVHVFSSVDELPPDAADREYLASVGIRSSVTVPFVVDGRVVGSLGFSAERERQWAPEIVSRLRLLAQVFAGAVARKRAEAALRAALDERVEFESLIADLAARFVSVDASHLDAAIEDAQRRLVLALDVDRSSLFQFSEAADSFVFTHQWARPGSPAMPVFGTAVSGMFPWISAKIRRGELVCVASVDDLPPAAADREHMIAVGTKSTVVVPLVAAGAVFGALTFGAIGQERAWPPAIVNRLLLVGQVFAAALARTRAETELRTTLDENARLRERLAEENLYLRREISERTGPSSILGESAAIRRVLGEVDQVAPTGATVLLLGETGTGKELIATAIHERSPRRARTMVRVNCAAIPIALIESELFGREKGAYTGALARQAGRFELADGSTIFLDEIGELSAGVQVKLLRVLQEREVERLGGTRPIKIDVRVIAATNRDVEQMVAAGAFRDDLYYRLNVFPIHVPPLRDRPDDIPRLVWSFVDELSRTLGKRIESISKDHMLALQRYPWPGNVRELRNVVERAMILATGPRLAIEPPRAKATGTAAPRSLQLEDVEREHIRAVLERTRWRIRGDGGAAAVLGLKPSTLEGRIAKLGLRRPAPD
jgi:formate hydrogenlyase transcriptional activator